MRRDPTDIPAAVLRLPRQAGRMPQVSLALAAIILSMVVGLALQLGASAASDDLDTILGYPAPICRSPDDYVDYPNEPVRIFELPVESRPVQDRETAAPKAFVPNSNP